MGTGVRVGRLAWLLVATAVAGFASPVASQTLRDSSLQAIQVGSGLSAPTGLAFIGPDDILVTQKNDGRVRRVVGGVLQPTAVLDVGVDSASERGLLGIALHPAFPATPFVYLYYTQSSTGADTTGTPGPLGNRVYRYTWTGNTLVSPSLLLDLPVTPGPNHDGGKILFGPDGKLYVVIGDLNRNGQLQNIATGPSADNTGVILRLNDDGSTPADNPFIASGGNLAKYFAYGVRNSFGMAFDPVTNWLWITENGPTNYDEINLVLRGFNSGWNRLAGPSARNPQALGNLVQIAGSQYRDPLFSWLATVGPTGIVFLNSQRLGAQYFNHVFVGDINFGRLYHFIPNTARDGILLTNPNLATDLVADNAAELDETILGEGFGGVTDLALGPDGRLYILSFQGRIYAVSQRESQAMLSASPGAVPAGSAVTATWSGIGTPSPTDWLGLYAPGAPATAFIDWIYTSCTKTAGSGRSGGSCTLVVPQDLPPGTYELRLFPNNRFVALATSQSFTVTLPGPIMSASPGAVPAGSAVTVTWSGNEAAWARDWIGLYAPGMPATAFLDWVYTSCTKTPTFPQAAGWCALSVPETLSPGPYEVRLLANDGFMTLATSQSFNVTPPGPSVRASPVTVSAGGAVTATWSSIPTPSPKDWIGLFVPGAPSTAFINWVYPSCTKTSGVARAAGTCPLTVPAGLTPGTYELRLLGNNGFVPLAASNQFTIVH